MELIYWVICSLFYIILGIILGLICYKVAESKGHNGNAFFWAGFFFSFSGLLIVIAYKDLNSEKQNSTIIASLNEIKTLLNDKQLTENIKKLNINPSGEKTGKKINLSKSSNEEEKATMKRDNANVNESNNPKNKQAQLINKKIWNRKEKMHGTVRKIVNKIEVEVTNKYGKYIWKIEDCDLN